MKKRFVALLMFGGFAFTIVLLTVTSDHAGHATELVRDGVSGLSNDSLQSKRAEIARLDSIGYIYETSYEYEKAKASYNDALRLAREAGDPKLEADNLEMIGFVHRGMSGYLRAIEVDSQALAIRQRLRDSTDIAASFLNLGDSYQNINRYRTAYNYFKQALEYVRALRDSSKDPTILNHLGINLLYLGSYDSAKTLFTAALRQARAVGDRENEGPILVNLGHCDFSIDEFKKAIEHYQQSLPILRNNNPREFIGVTYGHLASAYIALKRFALAQRSNDSALAIAHETGSLLDEGIAYGRNALIGYSRKRYSYAVTELQKALEIYEAHEAHERAGTAHYRMMLCYRELRRPRLAIFHGKMAVNAYQDVRRDIQQLDPVVQRDYARAKEDVYRELADLLVDQERIPEAEQVVGLLKNEETFEYIRGEDEIAGRGEKVDLTPEETEFDRRLSELAERIAPTVRLQRALWGKPTVSDADRQVRSRAATAVMAYNFAFGKALPRIEADLASSRFPVPKMVKDLQGELKKLGPEYVALMSLVGKQRYHMILITSEVPWVESYRISGKALKQELIDFRSVLQDAKSDPLPMAKRMYKILFRPVERHVRALGAKTLLWILDGAVRYIPMGALHDGNEYLCERYRTVLISPTPDWYRVADTTRPTAVGFGVSDPIGGFRSLPNVLDELPGIIDTTAGEKAGHMHGKICLNGQFTEQAMLGELHGQYQVVHVASHFQFNPGDGTKSFLLLGDGRKLTVRRFGLYPRIFDGVDLLTLSACNTALSSRSGGEGGEVDGFAERARQLGARSVLATLWSVADQSTSMLMQRFYRLRLSDPALPLSEALRQAQLALLRDSTGTQPFLASVHSGSGEPEIATKPESYKHPYYWAPFVLMGNSP